MVIIVICFLKIKSFCTNNDISKSFAPRIFLKRFRFLLYKIYVWIWLIAKSDLTILCEERDAFGFHDFILYAHRRQVKIEFLADCEILLQCSFPEWPHLFISYISQRLFIFIGYPSQRSLVFIDHPSQKPLHVSI